MKFKLFGFKGELSTLGVAKKKKVKEEKDDHVVGVGFRVYSEFAPGPSRFQKSSEINSATKPQQNGISAGVSKPSDWCGTKVPSQENIASNGYEAKSNQEDKTTDAKPKKEIKSIIKKAPEAPQPQTVSSPPSKQAETSNQNEEKSMLFAMRENAVKEQPENTRNNQPIYDDIQSVKQSSDGKKYITLGGFEDVEDSDSEDEFGAKKQKKTDTKSDQSHKNTNENAQSGDDFGYSDQAASIFFRSDSPEPEQRVRNFSIKKGFDDEDDSTSQTSV